jgi:peptidoglycan glycosyltransferase
VPPIGPIGSSAVPVGPPRVAGTLTRLFLALAIAYAALAGGLGYWQVIEASRLTSDPLNPLVLLAARQAPRGTIYASDGTVLARNVGTDDDPLRDYPYPVVAPVVGYRSTIFGAAGLERTYDAQLTGLLTLRAGDDLLRKFRAQPYNPSAVYTSINIELQQAAAQLLGNQRGAVVAIEPATGRVLALVSSPTFDPNQVVGSGGRRYVAALQAQTDSPLLNRATQGLYVPGSVFKIVTAMAALGSGSVTPQTTYEDQPQESEDGFLVEGFRIRDAPRRVQLDHPLDFYEATEVSSNVWYAHAGLDTGPENLLSWASRVGFGQRIPFELPTSPSQVNGGDGPLFGFRDRVELANAAYGQAELLVTPLQMALVASAVANDGFLARPKLVDELRAEDGSVTRLDPQGWGQIVDFGTAQLITDAMQLAVEGPFGEDIAGAAKVPGVPTAGKSGTAQLGGDAEPHSWFIGFAPADAPRIAIAVIVEGGGAGAQRAVPMAGQLMADYLKVN